MPTAPASLTLQPFSMRAYSPRSQITILPASAPAANGLLALLVQVVVLLVAAPAPHKSLPSWSVAQVESALVTTASNTLLMEDGVTHAPYTEGGAGRTRVDQAARAGLYFDVTPTQFREADPASGGQPKQLNLPFVHTDDCFERCSFTRVATANVAGTWQVQTVAPSGASITVTPNQFSASAGVAQSLAIMVDVDNASLVGSWLDAQIKLVPTNADLATTVLPVSVFVSPGSVP